MKEIISTGLVAVLLLAVCSLSSCSADRPKDAKKEASSQTLSPNESALPHGSSLPVDNLSEQDREKLANAKGREAQLIEAFELAQIVRKNENLLSIVNFWRLDCAKCLEMNQTLANIANQYPEEKLQLLFVNVDEPSLHKEVNTYIREQNFAQQVFLLTPSERIITFDAMLPQWNFYIPSTWMVKQSEGINLLYHVPYNKDEFTAVIEPLLL